MTSRNSRSNHQVELRELLTAWSENGATWNSPDAVQGWASGSAFGAGDYGTAVHGTLAPVGSNARLMVDVTTLVDAWVNQGQVNHGLLLWALGSDTGDAEWYNREEGDASRHPVLVVDWTLPPSQ